MGNDRKYVFLFGCVYWGIWGCFCLYGDLYILVFCYKFFFGFDWFLDYVF